MKNKLDSYLVAYKGGNLYDFDNEILLTWYPQRVLKHAVSKGSMLELGLGHGFTTNIFSEHFSRHIVLEGSPAVIQNFREKHPLCRAQLVQAYFEDFSTDQKFDVIIMGFILEHVDDPMLILRRYRTFLASGGKIFLAVPNAEVMNRRLGNLAGILDDMSALSPNDHLLGHKRYYTVESLTKIVEKSGYRIDRIEGIYLKPFTTKQILSLQLDSKIITALCDLGVAYPEISCGILAEISPTCNMKVDDKK